MRDINTFRRVPALVAATLIAVCLLVGTYTVIASPAPRDRPDLGLPDAANSDGAAGWDSGWVFIANDTWRGFVHDLGRAPELYAVEMWFLDLDDGYGLNRRYYGGAEANGDGYGADWRRLTANTIRVYRGQNDTAADRVRIRISIPPMPPDSDSGWTDVAAGDTMTFTHGLGITATELTVGMWFSSSNPLIGIHNVGYGGLAIDEDTRMGGAYWHNLTSNTVQVTRYPDDQLVDQVRLVVVHGTPPDYDSLVELGGWQSIVTGTNVFTHNLGWNPFMLTVRGECYSSAAGINQWMAGGNHDWIDGWQGASLQNVTSDTVEIFRFPDDQVCPQARIRIWKRIRRVYLPLVLDSYGGS